MAHVYRADTIGSLLRPPYLKLAREQFEAGQLEPAAYKEIEDRAVDQALAMQEGVGLDVVTDGELRRHTFIDQLTEQVEGLSPDTGDSGHIPVPFHDEAGQLKSVFTIPLSVTGTAAPAPDDDDRGVRVRPGPSPAPGQGDAAEPADAVPGLVAAAVTGRLPRPVRDVRRRPAADEGGSRGAGADGLPLHPGRRAGLRPAGRPGPAGRVGAGRDLRRPGFQRGRGHAERAGGGGRRLVRPPSVPGKLRQRLDQHRHLRDHLQAALPAGHQLRHVPAGVRRRAVRFVFRARRRPRRQDGGARAGLDQVRPDGAGRPAGRPDQRGQRLLPAGAARAVDAVRVRLGRTGQPDQRGRPGEQAAPGRRGRRPRSGGRAADPAGRYGTYSRMRPRSRKPTAA